MRWFGGATKKNDDSVGDVNSRPSAPDYMVPDIDAQSQQRTVASRAVIRDDKPTCRKRFCAEIDPRQNWFHVKDPVNGRVLDIPESFAPASCPAFVWKFFYCAGCIATMAYTMIESTDVAFYFAFLTNIGVLFTVLYSILSVLNTILASRTGQPSPDQPVGLRIRLTWILFTDAAHFSFVATLLFWPLVFDPGNTDVTYETVGPHGVLFILTCIDGFYVNRIPFRLMHWYGFVLPLDLAYLVWTILQSFLGIKNPEQDNDPTTNDDAIYTVLDWKHDWQTALFWSLMTLFVIGPILFILLWLVSTGSCCCCKKDPRKYVDSVDPTDTRPTVDDVEEGSIFAHWK
jgi:hypothetical protein